MFPGKTNMATDELITVYVTGMLSDVAYHMAELCAEVRINNEHGRVLNYCVCVRLEIPVSKVKSPSCQTWLGPRPRPKSCSARA